VSCRQTYDPGAGSCNLYNGQIGSLASIVIVPLEMQAGLSLNNSEFAGSCGRYGMLWTSSFQSSNVLRKKKVKTCLPSNNTAWDVGSSSRQVTKDAYVGVVKVQSQNACFWSTVTLASVCCSSLSCISVEHRSKLQLCKSQDPITSQHATVLQFLTFSIDEQAANMPNSDILSWQWHMLGLC